MGSNPQINGILRVSEHMYVCANAAWKEIFTHMRLSQEFDCSLGCLMSAELLHGVGTVGQEPSGSIRKSSRSCSAAAAELIVPDSSHTRAVSLVAAVEKICTSQCMLLLF